jgi:hypothetical protein
MKKMIWAPLALFMILSACNNTVSTADPDFSTSKDEKKKDKDDDRNTEDDNTETKTQVLNDISVETEGSVKVYRAFLSYESGDLVPSSNVTAPGKPIYLNLNITKGWKEEMGEVSLGASEKISTDNGTVLLDEPDLFQNYKSVSADDAKFIKLKAVVNNLSGPIKYFIVDYKVWDKNGDGVIRGSYKFYVE